MYHCIPRRKSVILRIQYGHAATTAEISFHIWYVGIYGQCHACYCFVPFFYILAQFSYTQS